MNEIKYQAYPANLAWRALALIYDAIACIAIWFVVSGLWLLVMMGNTVAPDSILAWLMFLSLWAGPGLYAVMSWRRGGQTLGMRPWQLKVLQTDGTIASKKALMLRYVVGTFSLALFGLGFLWILIDPQQRSWHDIASKTQCYRLKPL